MSDTPTQYCEFFIGYLFTQPLNVISNIIFFALAFIAYKHLCKYKINSLNLLPFLLGLIGIGSTWWHITNSPLGDVLDTISILVFASVSAVFLLFRITKSKIYTSFYFILLLTVVIYLERLPFLNGSLPYLALLVGFIFSGAVYVKKFKFARETFLIAVGVFSLAIAIRSIDLVLCNIFPIGTHFVWHILVALFGYKLILLLSYSEKQN